MRIFIPDYRMAPEFPYPAGLLDAADAYKSMLEQGIPAEHIIIKGDSGGGGLTTSLMGHLRDEGLPRPAAIALVLARGQPSARPPVGDRERR